MDDKVISTAATYIQHMSLRWPGDLRRGQQSVAVAGGRRYLSREEPSFAATGSI